MFSAGRKVLMTGQVRDRVMQKQRSTDAAQGLVLCSFKQPAFQTFEFYADGVVVAVAPAAITGLASVPSPIIAADELPQCARPGDKKMRGHLQPPQALEIRVRIPFQLIGKEPLHIVVAKLARWQADRVDDDQIGD